MATQGLTNRLRNLKTLPKLMLGFTAVSFIILAMGLIGTYAFYQMSTEFEIVYEDYTETLAELALIGTALGEHKHMLARAVEASEKAEFEEQLKRLPVLEERITRNLAEFESVVTRASPELRVSKSGRSEDKDLELFKKELSEYLTSATGLVEVVASVHNPVPVSYTHLTLPTTPYV